MKEITTLYCVIRPNGDIIGRFINKEHAIDYMIDCYFDGYDEKIIVKKMTTEEYLNYTRKLIDKYKD